MISYKLKSDSHVNIQHDCVKWFNENYPDLKLLLIAIPNDISNNLNGKSLSQKLKQLGYKNDAPDLFLAKPTSIYNGAFIEIVPLGERLRKNKHMYLNELKSQNYYVIIVNSLDDFISNIKNYISFK